MIDKLYYFFFIILSRGMIAREIFSNFPRKEICERRNKMLVSIGVVAEIFGVSTQTIRNWCEEGFLKVWRTRRC